MACYTCKARIVLKQGRLFISCIIYMIQVCFRQVRSGQQGWKSNSGKIIVRLMVLFNNRNERLDPCNTCTTTTSRQCRNSIF